MLRDQWVTLCVLCLTGLIRTPTLICEWVYVFVWTTLSSSLVFQDYETI